LKVLILSFLFSRGLFERFHGNLARFRDEGRAWEKTQSKDTGRSAGFKICLDYMRKLD
jgi:hypothetical protein